MVGDLSCVFFSLVFVVPVVVCGLSCDPSMGLWFDPFVLEPTTCRVEFAWALLAGGLVVLDARDDGPTLFHGDDRIYLWSGYVRRIDPSTAGFRLLCGFLFVRRWLLPRAGYRRSIGSELAMALAMDDAGSLSDRFGNQSGQVWVERPVDWQGMGLAAFGLEPVAVCLVHVDLLHRFIPKLRSGADALDSLSFRLLVLALCRASSAGDRASIAVGLDRWKCVFEVAYHQLRIDWTAALELPAIGQKHLAWSLSKRPQSAQVDLGGRST